MLRAMSAAEDLPIALYAMSNNAGATVRTGRRKSVDRALKAVEGVRLALVSRDDKGLIVHVSTVLTLFHYSARLLSIACYIYFHYIEKSEVGRNAITPGEDGTVLLMMDRSISGRGTFPRPQQMGNRATRAE